jgi:3-hydroxyacyl-CoA dehydrogenase
VLRLVVTNLTRRKGRTIATAIGIALGVATIVALLSIGAEIPQTVRRLVDEGALGKKTGRGLYSY